MRSNKEILNSGNSYNEYFLVLPLLLFSFFPYVTPHSFGTDIQPWSILLISIMAYVVFCKKIKLETHIYFLLLPFVFALFIFIPSSDTKSAIRSVLGYLSIGLIPIVFYYILKNYKSLFERLIKITTLVYFIVGLVQILFNQQFMSGFVNRMTTTENRGITSLSVEPTFYGLICFFLLLIFVTADVHNKNMYITLLIIQIIFLAQSTMTILLMLLYAFYYLLFKTNIRVLLLFFIGSSILILLILNTNFIEQDRRFFNLLRIFFSDPSNLISLDQSVNMRLADVYFPIKAFFENYMIPYGFDAYQDYLTRSLMYQSTFSGESGWVATTNRISSFYGSIFFELGLIGLIVPIVYSFVIIRAYERQPKNIFFNLFFINSILFSAIPLSFTFVGIYIASLIYKTDRQSLQITN